MPAIQPARLKTQVSDLLAHFAEPEAFIRELHALLDFYADRTRRPGLTGKPKPLIQAYNAPRQVLRRIEADLLPRVQSDPDGALTLADALWADAWFESRMLAVHILGALPLTEADTISERLQTWGQSCRDETLTDALLSRGASRLRDEDPDGFLRQVERWLRGGDALSRKLGLRAIPGLVASPQFENLPVLFRLLAPLLRDAESTLEGDLLSAVRALGRRSPRETAYFLQKNLQAPHKAGLEVITRKSLDVFPAELAETLRTDLRERRRVNRR